jgi:predicted secreted protein
MASNVPTASASATGSASPTVGIASGAGETTVRVEDDGKTFDVAAGSTLVFKLAGNAGTGFMWRPSGVNAAVLAQQGSVTHVTAGSTPGAANEDVYRFRAVAPGSSPVEMGYARPWEHGPAGKTIHVTVNVH